MLNENTSLKNVAPVGDSNTTHEVIMGKSKTYQRPLLIVAGYLLALLVWIAVTGKSDGQYFKSSVQEMPVGAVELSDYQVDAANLELARKLKKKTRKGQKSKKNQAQKVHQTFLVKQIFLVWLQQKFLVWLQQTILVWTRFLKMLRVRYETE